MRSPGFVPMSYDVHGSLMVKVSDCDWHVRSSSPVPLKTRHVGERCTLNLSKAQTSSRWSGDEPSSDFHVKGSDSPSLHFALEPFAPGRVGRTASGCRDIIGVSR
ncbi:hypothetical protein TNCV_4313151 [Trichonephila clavipes]|nr:hypothetical protein TNCV_4313151 [Trichonephila clavipes]